MGADGMRGPQNTGRDAVPGDYGYVRDFTFHVLAVCAVRADSEDAKIEQPEHAVGNCVVNRGIRIPE